MNLVPAAARGRRGCIVILWGSRNKTGTEAVAVDVVAEHGCAD